MVVKSKHVYHCVPFLLILYIGILAVMPSLKSWRAVSIGNLNKYSSSDLDDQYSKLSQHISQKYSSTNRVTLLSGSKLSSYTFNDNILEESKRDSRLQNLVGLEHIQENDGHVERRLQYRRENATLLMLVRNWELPGALVSMRSLEDRFNRDYHYDWVFMNDVPFTKDFMEATTAMASGNTSYVLIPSLDWDRPNSIDISMFNKRLKLFDSSNVLYGKSPSYRNMCHFNSGYFFRQEILNNYDYYFRVEPDVEYFCDFPYDPFKVMRVNKKKYGFVISLREYEETIPTLWEAVQEYINIDNGETIDRDANSYDFITDDDVVGNDRAIYVSNSDYNMCHFWTNFEIGDLNFFRSDKYTNFFNHLDSKGGFYYERWGDAPVHSIAVSLLLKRDEVIHFDELGYQHAPYYTCPTSYYLSLQQRCRCQVSGPQNIQLQTLSCLRRWWKYGSGKKFMKEL